jgi:uncharacterized protein (TIGR02678 family)
MTRPNHDTGTASRAARERLDAARALLDQPVLTIGSHPDELTLIRLHAPALRNTFKTLLGYNLVVESSFARLVKAPIDSAAPPRPARRHDDTPFTPLIYTHLALLCAALLSPATAEQILISALIDQVRSDAAAIGVQIGDTPQEVRALVTAIGQLTNWGLISETDGTAAAWGERREEALLTVHRALLPHVLARPLSQITHPDQLLDTDPADQELPRRSLRRKLVENPIVRREDMTDAERDVLSRERRELTRLLEENFGLFLEVRAEGALAYDTSADITDIAFPGNGAVKQASLLLLSDLIGLLEPEAGQTAVLDDGRIMLGVKATSEQVRDALAELAAAHGKAWGAFVENPERMRSDVIALLCQLSLATATGDGLVIHPASARYRPRPHVAPPTRASRRLHDDDGADENPLF